MTAFTLTKADLAFMLFQIKVAEMHASGVPLTEIRVNADGTLISDRLQYNAITGVYLGDPATPQAIPDPHVPVGLRTVDGSYNNIVAGREYWGAADQVMPRLLDPYYLNDADGDVMGLGPGATVTNNNYGVGGAPSATNGGNLGNVADADPRIISNLIVDMSLNNPSAILAALTFAGSEDPYADMQTLLAARLTPAEAAAALLAAQNALASANAALQTAADNMIVTNPASIDAVQTAAAAVTAAEHDLDQATAMAANPTAAFQALAVEMGLVINSEGSLVIPNVSADEGLSAPFNAWMTFFGQFFDHGLDLITKGNNGTIYVPLQHDDPLYNKGADGIAGTADDGRTNFMVLTRATPAGGSQTNTTTAFVDQNQTYTSHASHQVFLREYTRETDGDVVATGKLLDGIGPDGVTKNGLPTWADVKAQALNMLGLRLSDQHVLEVPLLATDQYGMYERGANGYAQVLVQVAHAGGLTTLKVEGKAGGLNLLNITAADLPAGHGLTGITTIFPIGTRHAFLDDIAHNAVPSGVYDPDGPGGPLGDTPIGPDSDTATGNVIGTDYRGRKVAYDDELLNRHYITGDGRGNENIGLTAVHHVFHSEHNRQIDAQKLTVLRSGDLAFINEWLSNDGGDITALPAGFQSMTPLQQLSYANSLSWDGERLFQAARFATEMQYQHLVFEEFARKVQPAVDVFVFNSITDINPSIFSEFANVVYRFGHSMLTDTMPRIFLNADGDVTSTDDMGLITSFLNPVSFENNETLTAEQAAGAVVRGMTIERGNEIDEFITGSLRNSLLGLPLDLATINIARARDTGMPTLNQARDQLFGATGSSFLTPYASWTDFAANLKNPISVVNFIGAYGTHSSITAATTVEAKRDAAWNLVFGNDALTGPAADAWNAERLAFLNSTGTWNAQTSGLNAIDLWIGGLAEKKMPFGGFLGSTFNAVFEAQLENLQDGDRFYYLTRTQGQNFLNMLEQNSFAKMIMANTDIAQPGADGIRGTADDIISRHIGVDSFAAYDFVLEVDASNQQDYNGAAAGKDPLGNDLVLESLGLGRVQRDNPGTVGPDANYLRFTGGEHVVVGGTNGNDTIITDFGDDGIWGDAGDDRIESGAGVDLVNGGSGNDIITDSGDSGDFIKGDEGDDVIANSNGIDILMGGIGNDVVFVGVDATEVFGGEGNDFILGGDDADFLLGNEGDDWLEGGGGFDTTAGDNSELFFNSAIKGHDVMFSGSEEHDFDAESGDDIMVQGESVIRNEGMFGFDWSIYKGNEIAANADLRVPIFTTEQADILRNRFDKVEALSGWEKDDILRGDDRLPDAAGTATIGAAEGVFFQDELTQAGVNRIDGFRALLGNLIAAAPTTPGIDLENIIAFNQGNVLLGGAGSDQLQGNGGNDLIDGDAWLNVRIRITGAGQGNAAGNQIATVDSLKHTFTAAENPAWAGKSLFELLVSRTIVPNQLHIVREVVTTGAQVADEDTAIFNDIRANYTITSNADGTITVTHDTLSVAIDPLTGRPLLSDGVDTLRNMEWAQFSDGRVRLAAAKLQLDGPNIGEYQDQFGNNSFGNSDGDTQWNPDWIETNDSGGVTTGQIRIDPGAPANNVMQFIGGTVAASFNGAEITRVVPLAGATTATLRYSADPASLEAGESVLVQFAANGVDFVTVNAITGDGANVAHTHTLTGPFSAASAIRFVASAMNEINDIVLIDNVTVDFTLPGATNFEDTFTEGGGDADISDAPFISDATVIVSARIVLTNAQAGDAFDVPGNLPGNINSTIVTAVAGQITVLLTGSETVANYQAAIQAIEFRNTSQSPSQIDRIINVTVNNGIVDSNVAVATINVISVNDAPNAVTDNLITNIAGAITVPEWLMLFNDTDAEGDVIHVTGATENDVNFSIVFNAGNVTATRTDADNTKDFTYTLSDGTATDTADVDITWDTVGTVNGTNGADILLGDGAASVFDGAGGNDIIMAGAGNDTIGGGTGNDLIVWNVGHGRDFIDGGANTDTVRIVGDGTDEVYRVYSRASALAAGMTGLNPNTEIVITRGGTTNAFIIAELDNIEEIVIDTGAGTDQVIPIGTFNQTSLSFSTITVNGGADDDTVDISGLLSAHRILFRSNGGNDTILGTLRPQDVVELAPGEDIASYTLTNNSNGTKTLSNGTNSITFTGAVPPQFQETPDTNENENGVSGNFEYTASDLAGLKALVNGQSPEDSDDPMPTGVRTLSGHGNNLADPDAGAADTPFIRITDAHYGESDSFGNSAINPIFVGLDPRNISNILGAQEADLPKAEDANTFFMAFGQYFDHGLDFLGKGGNGTVQIGAPGNGAPGSGNPADLTRGTVAYYEDGVPQHINKTSPFVDQNQAYGSNDLVGQFLRQGDGDGGLTARLLTGGDDPSNPAFKLMPTLREMILHHWENDTVFESPNLPGGQTTFRAYYAGLVAADGVTITASMLPAMASDFMGSTHALLLDTNPYISLLDHYVAGDGRANENIALTSMHTIWARNHNFHVEGLTAAGFQGSPEEIFQAAKMINEAEYQRVVFTEFADKLIGGIRGVGDHGFNGYNPDATAAISHEFAAAVYRVGHSLIGQTMTVLDANGNPTQVTLFDAFLNPTNDATAFTAPLSTLAQYGYIPQPGYEQLGVNAILGGIAQQPAEAVDFNIVDAVRNDLVRINADLFAFNVARGWDIGLGTLNQVRTDLAASMDPYVREAAGFTESLSAYVSWEDFQARNGLSATVIAQFKQAYPDLVLSADEIEAFNAINPSIAVMMQSDGTGIVKGIDRVDLWVGGLAEKHINGGMVGQTFWIVLHEQFDRLQEADRFYYTERFDDFDFYENFIDGQSFADIVARNTGMTDLQEDIFSPRIDDNGNDGDEDDDTDNDDDDDDDGDVDGDGEDDDGDADGDTDGEDDGDDDDDGDTDGEDDGDDDGDTDGDDDGDDNDGEDDDDDDTDDTPGEDEDDDDTDGEDDDDDCGPGTHPGTGGGGTAVPLPAAAVALIGTAAGEVLAGNTGDDTILAGGGSDILSGDAGSDILRGEDGDDVITAGGASDVASGGAGDDEVHGGGGNDFLFGNAGSDLVFGDDGDDIIEGGAADDQVWGGTGNDTVLATANDGNDRYWGDAGIDTLDYSVATANLTVDIGAGFMGHGSVSGGTTGSDTFYGFENFIGGSGHDVITASSLANVLDGGLGEDTFRFTTSGSAHGDTIYGFQPGDKIDFSAIDANTGVAGNQDFVINTGASLTAVGGVAITHEMRDGEEFTIIRGHTDADNGADFELAIAGRHTLTSSDFSGVA
ncbi:peroxidase family protein [Pararhizobium sp.]|uniref:peroxidase family protein n=1 Tax=Pararhizobium sp. TaxID=1977563 RepID=UPI0027263BC4|nr:peroxidase family protein [Pararhizobium sp.]MDO9417829.1 peroxidase family protein [Pararhizobium sp.]